MSDIQNFIYENYKFIIALVLTFIGLLVFISVYNINLETPKLNTKLAQVVTVETFNVDESIKKGLNEYKKNPGVGSLYHSDQSDYADYSEEISFPGHASFCDKHSSNPTDLERASHNLSSQTCKNLPCTALIGGANTEERCIAANKYGPIFKKDSNGNLITMDYYYYQGTKYNVSK